MQFTLRAFRLVALAVASFGSLTLAATVQIAEPQYIGRYDFIGPTGQLIPLESAQGKMESKSRSIIIANKISSAITIPGAASTVRVGPVARFVVRAAMMDGIDPNTLITLRAFTVDGAKRTIPTSSASGVIFGGAKGGTATIPTIPLSFKKYGQNSLEITPQQPLPPGEYTIGRASLGQPYNCFGVDSNGPTSATVVAVVVTPPPPPPPAIPAFVKWSVPLQAPTTSDVKAACESSEAARQAYCYGIVTEEYGYILAEGDNEGAKRTFCLPNKLTGATLRDTFLAETRTLPDQLSGPFQIFGGVPLTTITAARLLQRLHQRVKRGSELVF